MGATCLGGKGEGVCLHHRSHVSVNSFSGWWWGVHLSLAFSVVRFLPWPLCFLGAFSVHLFQPSTGFTSRTTAAESPWFCCCSLTRTANLTILWHGFSVIALWSLLTMVVIHFLLFEKWKWWQLPQVSTTNTGRVKKNQFREGCGAVRQGCTIWHFGYRDLFQGFSIIFLVNLWLLKGFMLMATEMEILYS